MDVINWLLNSEPWVRYRTRIDLLDEDPNSVDVTQSYEQMLAHPKIQTLLAELNQWPGEALKNHKKAGHLLHKLVFIADLGIKPDNMQVESILRKVKANQDQDGPFQIIVNLPKAFGGTGLDELSWMLCDASLTLYAMAKLGGIEDPAVQRAADYLAGLVRESGGWSCTAASNLGKFRGPGKSGDPCPYVNLLMIKALVPFKNAYNSAIKSGAETLLELWQQRQSVRPFLFAMGSGFVKLKAPLIWYDILHVLDVLSQVPETFNNPTMLEMVEVVRNKSDHMGRYQPESIWMDWRGWDFGQKREPSPWITFLVRRMCKRLPTV